MTTDSEHETASQEDVVEVEGKPRMATKKAIDAKRGVNTFAVDPDELVLVGFDTEHKRGEHPLWQTRASEEPDEGLVQDMTARGFTSVIDVRRDGPTLEVVTGRRRVKAAREANARLKAAGKDRLVIVQCKVFKGSDAEASRLMISENALRKDVDPVDMAYDIQACINFGSTDEEAARACGKSVAYMRQLLSLLDLGSEVQKAVRQGVIAPSAAFHLSTLTRDEQKGELEKIAAGAYKPTVKAVEGAVKAIRNGETSATLAPAKGLLKKIAAHEDAERILGEDGLLALKWMLGLTKPRTIPGLSDLIRKVSE
jgi:ParB family chromosome partitioning protein